MTPVVNLGTPTNLRSHIVKDQLNAINFAKKYGNKKAAFKYDTTKAPRSEVLASMYLERKLNCHQGSSRAVQTHSTEEASLRETLVY